MPSNDRCRIAKNFKNRHFGGDGEGVPFLISACGVRMAQLLRRTSSIVTCCFCCVRYLLGGDVFRKGAFQKDIGSCDAVVFKLLGFGLGKAPASVVSRGL